MYFIFLTFLGQKCVNADQSSRRASYFRNKGFLPEFERISERGGVLGAMDTMYQRGKIQEESLYYESMKHDGSLPLIGANSSMFMPRAR